MQHHQSLCAHVNDHDDGQGFFNACEGLKVLDLTNNKITVQSIEAAVRETVIESLTLNSNALVMLPNVDASWADEDVSTDVGCSMDPAVICNLYFLSFANNALKTLPSNGFSGLVVSINLENNFIDSLPADLFGKGAGQLKEVDFSHNEIEEIPQGR